jgi:multisubunit Na+/H+ antiporter MnhB subunit
VSLSPQGFAELFAFVGVVMLGVLAVPASLVYRRRASIRDDLGPVGRWAMGVAGLGALGASLAPFLFAAVLLTADGFLTAYRSPVGTLALWLLVGGLTAMVGGVVVATADLLRGVVAAADPELERRLARAGVVLAVGGGVGVVVLAAPSTRPVAHRLVGATVSNALTGAFGATFVGGVVLRWVR